MKKVYIISVDNVNEFCFSSRRKAIEQIEIIKNLILSGRWFTSGINTFVPAENYEFCKEYSYSDKAQITYVFRDKKNNKLFTYRMFIQEINFQVYKGI